MTTSRFRDSSETLLVFKHLSDFVEMQPVREPAPALLCSQSSTDAIFGKPTNTSAIRKVQRKYRVQFNPIDRAGCENPVIVSEEDRSIHSGQNGRIAMKHHYRSKT